MRPWSETVRWAAVWSKRLGSVRLRPVQGRASPAPSRGEVRPRAPNRRSHRSLIAACLLGALAPLPRAEAAVPQSFTYQGNLWENNAPVNSSKSMLFRITDADGTAVYWSTGPFLVPVNRGHFTVALVPTGLSWAGINPHIEVTVDGNLLLPREALNAVPYSLHALAAERASAGPADPPGAPGMIFYRTDLGRLRLYNGAWQDLAVGGESPWLKSGNAAYIIGGSVGIGTASPQYSLHVVNGSIRSEADVFAAGAALAGDGASRGFRDLADNGAGYAFSSGNLTLQTGAAERMRIDAAGRVGIGTTNVQSALHVHNGDLRLSGTGGIYFTDGSFLGSAGAGSAVSISNSGDAILTGDADANSSGSVLLRTGSNTRLIVTNAGNVGIGTLAPAQRLDVAGTVKATAYQGDGSALTGVAASGLGEGTYANRYLFSHLGSTFTASQLLSGSGLPLSVKASPGAGAGGSLSVEAGDAGAASGGAGGNLLLRAGNPLPAGGIGYGNLGAAGAVTIQAGNGYNNVGGNVTLLSGSNTNWSQTLGNYSKVSLQGGALLGGDGALLEVEGAKSGSTSNAALVTGGSIRLTGGNGIGGQPGGNILLSPGGGSPAGKVGIGTNAPTQALDVAGTVKALAFLGDGSQLTGIATPGLPAGTYPNLYSFTHSGSSFTAAQLASGAGLPLSVKAGNGAGTGGGLTVAAGDAGVPSGGAGGNLTLQAGSNMPQGGAGYTNLGASGVLTLNAGNGYNSKGADVILNSGSNSPWSQTADGFSKVSLRGGLLNAGDAAVLDVEGGHNINSSGSAISKGGSVRITAGNGVGAYAGGSIVLSPGTGTPAGGVGIGTASPQEYLHLYKFVNGSFLGAKIENTGPFSAAGIKLKTPAVGSEWTLMTVETGGGVADAFKVQHPTLGDTLVIKANSGNVGIGTSAPSNRLEINDADANTVTSGLKFTNFACIGTDKLTANASGVVVCAPDAAGSGTGNIIDTLADTLAAGNDAGGRNILGVANLGVGTSAPARQVHVFRSVGNPGLRIETDQPAQASIFEIGRTSNLWSIATTGAAQDDFSIANQPGGGAFVSRFYISPTGNVGIGTTAPAAKLEIRGSTAEGNAGTLRLSSPVTVSGDLNKIVFLDTAGGTKLNSQIAGLSDNFAAGSSGLAFLTTSVGATTEKMRISGDGNIGIGIATPGALLHLNQSNAIASQTLSVAGMSLVVDAPSPDVLLRKTASANQARLAFGEPGGISSSISDTGKVLSYNSEAHKFYGPASLPLLFLSGNGNVGIGMTIPTEKLHVVGSIMAEGTGGGGRVIMKGTGAGGHQYEWYPDSPALGDLELYDRTAARTAVSVKAGGNVGIGTGSPGQKLTVAGTIESTSGGFKFPDGSVQTSAGTGGGGTASGTAGRLAKFTSTSALGDSVITEALGSVGIGTSAPASNAKLDVRGDILTSAVLRSESNGILPYEIGLTNVVDAALELDVPAIGAADRRAMIGPPTAGTDLAFKTVTERMRITAAGNVGIGTTGPRAKLEIVNGSANVNGDVVSEFATVGPDIAPTGNTGNIFIQTNDAMAADKGGTLALGGRHSGGGAFAGAMFAAIKGAKENGTSNDVAGYLSFITRVSGSGGTEKLRITSAGNVGIGIATPGALLHINQSNAIASQTLSVAGMSLVVDAPNPDVLLRKTASANQARLAFGEPGGISSSIQDVSKVLTFGSEGFRFYGPSNLGLLFLTGSGNVGIGTSAPSNRLEINDADANTVTSGLKFTNFACIGTDKLTANASGVVVCAPDAAGSGTGNIIDTLADTLAAGNDAGGRNILGVANLGVGTSAPARQVHVFRSVGNPGLRIETDQPAQASIFEIGRTNNLWSIATTGAAQDDFSIANQPGGGAFVSRFYISPTGNVGIGTTAPAAKLEIRGTTAEGNAGTLRLSSPVTVSGDLNKIVFLDTAGGAKLNSQIAGLSDNFAAGSSGLAFLTTSVGATTEKMRISGDGNVGIGTTSPAAKLEVAGVIRANNAAATAGSAAEIKTYRSNGTGAVGPSFSLGQISFNGNRGDATEGTAAAILALNPSGTWSTTNTPGEIAFFTTQAGATNLSERMRINHLGNVGIGASSNVDKLIVAGTINSTTGGFKFPDGTVQTTAVSGSLTGNGTLGKIAKYASATSLGDSALLESSGNIGIGTASAGSRLELNASQWLMRLADSDDYTNRFDFHAYQLPAKQLRLNEGFADANLMTWNMDGKVGVGTSAPAYKLDVAGQANATQLCIAGDCRAVWPTAGAGSQWTTSGSDVYYNAGNVGIGTDFPVNTLEINGTAHVRGALNGTGLYVDSQSRVGIGTTSPFTTLDVSKAAAGAFNEIRANNTDNSGGSRVSAVSASGQAALSLESFGGSSTIDAAGPGDARAPYGAALYWNYFQAPLSIAAPSSYIRFFTGSATASGERMRIDKFGDISIGSTGAQAKLDVHGTAFLRGGVGGTGLYVNSSGNVGIGMTNPGAKLEVAGGINLKADGVNTGALKVGYAASAPAGYYAVYAP